MTYTGFMTGSHFNRATWGVMPVPGAREIHRKIPSESKLFAMAKIVCKLLIYM